MYTQTLTTKIKRIYSSVDREVTLPLRQILVYFVLKTFLRCVSLDLHINGNHFSAAQRSKSLCLLMQTPIFKLNLTSRLSFRKSPLYFTLTARVFSFNSFNVASHAMCWIIFARARNTHYGVLKITNHISCFIFEAMFLISHYQLFSTRCHPTVSRFEVC